MLHPFIPLPSDDPREVASRAQDSLARLARDAGFTEYTDDTWGPCPLCGVGALRIVSNKPADPFLLCGQRHPEKHCYFGAGISALMSWIRRGWRLGLPLP